MENHNIAVIIPTYKTLQDLTENEFKSLQQGFKVLNDYPIALMCPYMLDTKDYKKTAAIFNINLEEFKFADHFFRDTQTYNKLLLSENFYTALKKFTYILIYQLDAWIFRDELKIWQNKGYSYVGAPLFENYAQDSGFKFIKGQNGGFSLRECKNALLYIRRYKKIKKTYEVYRRLTLRVSGRTAVILTKLTYKLFKRDQVKSYQWFHTMCFDDKINEDYYWSVIFPETFFGLKICPAIEALKFSFEVNPSYLYKLNNNCLPMGCHAWEKYENEFWQNYIR